MSNINCLPGESRGLITHLKKIPAYTGKTIVVIFQSLIKLYTRLISPLIGQNCRYHPTCSSYADKALEEHGVLKGLFLALRRILRCHPWSKYPFIDPVPKHFTWASLLGYKRTFKQLRKPHESE